MKKIGHFLKKKEISKKIPLDDKSVFYVFDKIVKEEYGNRGAENIKMERFRDGKLFLKTGNSNWSNEVWLNRQDFIDKINKELGFNEIKELSV